MHHRRALALLALASTAANAVPQGVTQAIPPLAGLPSGCVPDFPSTFGIAVVTLSRSSASGASTSGPSASGPSAASVATQSPDGQVGPGRSTATPAPTPVAQISDGQIQRQNSTVPAVAQISDGQIQRQSSTVTPVAQISDGQIQRQTTTPRPTVAPVTQIGDGQIQATLSTVTIRRTITSAQPATQLVDGQPQVPTSNTIKISVSTSLSSTLVTSSRTTSTSSRLSPRQAAPSPSISLSAVACKSQYALTLSLNRGTLTDNQGRTGYIASNYQFQYDKPAQAGAIYTTGFGICPQNSTTQNTLLALGGGTTFYQCLSGNFYNIYDRDFGAGQCSPIQLQAVALQDC